MLDYSSNFKMINNYVYLYHTDTLLIVPEYADSVTDTIQVDYQTSTALTRTAPIYSYSNSGPRSMQVAFNLHRDLMRDINEGVPGTASLPVNGSRDYVDLFIDEIQAAALPSYQSPAKMVNPPMVAVRLGSDIFIKGVVRGSVGVTYKYPIIAGTKLVNGKLQEDSTKHRYSNVDVTFTIEETDPYDAETVMQMGSYRGLSTTLERNISSAFGKLMNNSN